MDDRLRALGFREYDVARYLDTPELIAAYVDEALTDDESLLEIALQDAARARAMHNLGDPPSAKPSQDGLLESLDKAQRALKALGMRLKIVAA